MRRVAGLLVSSALFVLLTGLEWEGSRARWLRDLQGGDELHRIDALHGLATLGGPEVDEAIALALADVDPDVRLEAALACESRALAVCAAPIAQWLDSTDPETRTVAARVLGRVGSEGDTPRLARALGDARPQVRRAAVLGLGGIGGAAAVQALVSALTDADPIVRERAVTALGAIAEPAGQRVVASTALLSLVRDEAPEVRTAALDALGSLADARTGAAAVVALDDDVVEVRLAAMRALTRVPSTVATAALVIASADEDRLGRAALAALARVPGDVALDAIVSALLRSSVARSAEDALEVRMRESEDARVLVVSALARAIAAGPPDRQTRLAASASRLSLHVSIAGLEDALADALTQGASPTLVEALGRTGAERALVPILDGLGSEASATRSAALAGLEGLAAVHAPDGRILDPLTLAFPSLDPDEQARAITVAGLVPGARASEWLLARLDDGSRAGRIAALRALRDRAPSSAGPRLAALLEDPDAEVRSRAALALAQLAVPGQVDESLMNGLADALASDDARDRPAILLALGPMLRAAGPGAAGDPARAALMAAFDASDPELADSAAWAIAQSGDDGLAGRVLSRVQGAGPVETVRIVRALSGIDPWATAEVDAQGRYAVPGNLEEARAYCAGLLEHPDVVVRVAALATLAEIADLGAAERIARHVPSMRFPETAAASFALARLAARGREGPALETALATLAASHDPYVRANVAVAATHLHLTTLAGASPLDWLAPSMPPVVRIAGARWAASVRDQLDGARVDALLAACIADLTQPGLARACATPSSDIARQDADVIALDALGRPMPDRWIALRFADGSALVTQTDARGRVLLRAAPAGPLSLDAPESAVLVP